MIQSTPRPFELLKLFGMHNFVQLSGQQPIELGDASVDSGLHVLGDDQLPLHYLVNKLADHILGLLGLHFVARHFPFFQDAREQVAFALLLDSDYAFLFTYLRAHCDSSFAEVSPEGLSSPRAELNCACAFVSEAISFNIVSSLSLPSILDTRSESRWRAVTILRKGSTCCTTLSG